jgi:hypothetical protein
LERLIFPRKISARFQDAVIHEFRPILAVPHFGNLNGRRADIDAEI